MRVLLWVRMKWLLFRQMQMEQAIDRKDLQPSDPAYHAAFDKLNVVVRQKHELRKRLGRRTD